MPTMVSEILVRDALARDLESVTSVLRAANREFEEVVPAAFYDAYQRNVLAVDSRLGDAQLLVAERSSQIVGTITLYPDASREGWGWPAEWAGIRAVAVEPSARGLGVGRRLAESCIERARQLDASAVCLHTAPFMSAAIAMYQAVGFRRAPEFDGDAAELLGVAPLESYIPALAYRLDLTKEAT